MSITILTFQRLSRYSTHDITSETRLTRSHGWKSLNKDTINNIEFVKCAWLLCSPHNVRRRGRWSFETTTLKEENNVTIRVPKITLNQRNWGLEPKLWSRSFEKLRLEHHHNRKVSRNDSRCSSGSRLEQLEHFEHLSNI